MSRTQRPRKTGLYDPAYEHDACGVGFVAHVKGERSHQIVLDADRVLRNMDHRGARGCEPNTGDGAGILTALPHEFLRRVARDDLGVTLPPAGRYAAGLVFLPRAAKERAFCKAQVESLIAEHGQLLLGWRAVPTDAAAADLGPTARASEPIIEQLFVAAGGNLEGDAFERQLYLIRKRASHALRSSTELAEGHFFYVPSLSTRVIVYKGMLTPDQVLVYYPDLDAPDYTTHLAMVHSRFATNTFPSWDRAQPNRFMSHNGEINTLRGNINWMFARQGVLKSDFFGADLQKLYPIAEPDCSDSGTFDNVLEFLMMTGRSLQESVVMMIPEAWQNDDAMPPEKRAFYEYKSCIMEPWDGPASVVFTDGKYIGAVLDRNGLRPSRYYLTTDDRVIMASEAGVLPVDPALVKLKGRLQPGRMFLVDFEAGRLIPDEEVKSSLAKRRPYAQWLVSQRLQLSDLKTEIQPHGFDPHTLLPRSLAFGYTTETLQFMLLQLVTQKRDPVGSMGNDAALAVLSAKPRLIYDYFKQLFAQVTNPPIDSIREEIIMSLECYIGPELNLVATGKEHAHRLRVPHPILSNEQLAALKHINTRGWSARTIDITYAVEEGADGFERALDRICAEAEAAVDTRASLLVLSDREMGPQRVPVSALVACGAVHHHLIRRVKRTRIGILLETGEAREVHHHCLLVGYGADGINPYLAFENLWHARDDGSLVGFDSDEALVEAYRKGVAKGMLKVMAKMGISTLQSYKGAQIFEAVGLGGAVIDRCFAGTASPISGIGFAVLAQEALLRHRTAYPERNAARLASLPNDGQFHWRANGEHHMLNPQTIAAIQLAARTDNREAYRQFSHLVNEDDHARCTLRSLLRLRPAPAGPIPLDAVEPAKQIVKRFRTGAMSYGSISKEAHEALAIALNRIGGKSNTGEGGEDPSRSKVLPNGDSRRSAIKQVASGRFGVTSFYLSSADELQIKIAQGAKPGEGGELPGHKVDRVIAKTRYSTPGVGLISPPPHHDIYSIEDLAQLIHDLKNANPSAKVSVKLVSEVGVGTVAAGVAKAHADHILISGHDGGTGASPLTSIKHAGLPWELGLAEVHQTLVLNDLRSRVRLETDGQLKTGRDVVIAACLGAEEYGFATTPLITLGCVMMRKCHLNTCPVGVATQDKVLRKKFSGQPEHVVNYLFMVAEEVRQLMAELGASTLDELIGRVDLLEQDRDIAHWKAATVDLTPLIAPAERLHEQVGVRCTTAQDHGLDGSLDRELIRQAKPAIDAADRVRIECEVRNVNRVVGTTLSHEITRRWGEMALPDDTVHIKLTGSAGQSLGAWLVRGVTVELEGDANDYVGKGLCGGKLIIYPSKRATFQAEDNMIVGNVALYGATGGYAFLRGRAAERFCVRNSGARAVVEGVGDHGCEYMTGGRAVILGPFGRNFAAGMSGGIAYVWDRDRQLPHTCNLGMVELEEVETSDDILELRDLVSMHRGFTGSTVAKYILEHWDDCLTQFVKVFPMDYKRILEERMRHDEELDGSVSPGYAAQ
ncbi:MAG: glutamate synthase large subunit [Polyangiaceae bacterium]|nr:glutamate synthase large subunit [Polyangiaceae bacterium]